MVVVEAPSLGCHSRRRYGVTAAPFRCFINAIGGASGALMVRAVAAAFDAVPGGGALGALVHVLGALVVCASGALVARFRPRR